MNEASHDIEGPVFDLDELIQEPVSLTLFGKNRKLVPLDVEGFLKLTNKMAQLKKLSESENTGHQLVKTYFELFRSCIEPIELEEVYRMQVSQCAFLMSLVLSRQYGKTPSSESSEEKKKTSRSSLSSLARPIWFQTQHCSLVGSQTRL